MRDKRLVNQGACHLILLVPFFPSSPIFPHLLSDFWGAYRPLALLRKPRLLGTIVQMFLLTTHRSRFTFPRMSAFPYLERNDASEVRWRRKRGGGVSPCGVGGALV